MQEHQNPGRVTGARTSRAAGIGLTVAALALTLGIAEPAGAATGSGWVGRSLPEVAWNHPLRTASGQVHRLSEWKGRRLVINFWATWCAPCRDEMPRLARLNGALESRGGVLVAVSVDSDPLVVSQYLMNEPVAVPAVVDGPDGLAKALELKQLPLTWFVDESGRIVDEVAGGSSAGLDRLAGRALSPAGGSAAAVTGTVADGEASPR